MSEFLFDVTLIIVGAFLLGLGWRLLIHNSDRKLLRRFRPRYENPGMSKDETVASRSLNLAMSAIVLKVMGSILLIVGVLRMLGFGRG